MSDEDKAILTPRERQALEDNPLATIVQPATEPPARPDLIGVGGWLGFLAFSLTVLGPLVTLGQTSSELRSIESQFPEVIGTSQWENAIIITWAITAAYCAISIFAGYRLFKHHVPETVPIVICCLWIAGPLLGLVVLAISEGDSQAGVDVVRSLIGVGVWTAYLLRSQRVKNTYRSPQLESSLTETFR